MLDQNGNVYQPHLFAHKQGFHTGFQLGWSGLTKYKFKSPKEFKFQKFMVKKFSVIHPCHIILDNFL